MPVHQQITSQMQQMQDQLQSKIQEQMLLQKAQMQMPTLSPLDLSGSSAFDQQKINSTRKLIQSQGINKVKETLEAEYQKKIQCITKENQRLLLGLKEQFFSFQIRISSYQQEKRDIVRKYQEMLSLNQHLKQVHIQRDKQISNLKQIIVNQEKLKKTLLLQNSNDGKQKKELFQINMKSEELIRDLKNQNYYLQDTSKKLKQQLQLAKNSQTQNNLQQQNYQLKQIIQKQNEKININCQLQNQIKLLTQQKKLQNVRFDNFQVKKDLQMNLLKTQNVNNKKLFQHKLLQKQEQINRLKINVQNKKQTQQILTNNTRLQKKSLQPSVEELLQQMINLQADIQSLRKDLTIVSNFIYRQVKQGVLDRTQVIKELKEMSTFQLTN